MRMIERLRGVARGAHGANGARGVPGGRWVVPGAAALCLAGLALALLPSARAHAQRNAPAGPAAARAAAGRVEPAEPVVQVEQLKVKVLATYPHDPRAFTQGLVWHRGALLESTGLYNASSLREVEIRTGVVKRRLEVPPGFFAEGLALVGDRLIQLTWREQTAFVYSLRSFERTSELRYQGEGWGLCYDGRRLVMSDGSDQLTFRDPSSFAATGSVHVTLAGRGVAQLNELECVDGMVYANVWQTDHILRIDPRSGQVTAVIEASGLLAPEEKAAGADVLNGIAYDTLKKTFLITGKLWPKLFEVVWEPRPAGGQTPGTSALAGPLDPPDQSGGGAGD